MNGIAGHDEAKELPAWSETKGHANGMENGRLKEQSNGLVVRKRPRPAKLGKPATSPPEKGRDRG